MKTILLQLLVGCDEILTNILRHGYGLDKPPGPLWGGLGLPLVRRVFSHVHFYTYDQRGSEIVLEKIL